MDLLCVYKKDVSASSGTLAFSCSPLFPGLAVSLGGLPCLSVAFRVCLWRLVGWLLSFSFSVGCSRGCFFSFLPFSFSSLCCLLVSACRGVPPRLVCFLFLCPCLGLWFFGSAGVSRWSVVSGSCVGVGCLSPRCSFFWCCCFPRRSLWLVSCPLVLRRGSGFFSCLGCLSLSCCLPALALPFGFVGWGLAVLVASRFSSLAEPPRGLPLLASLGRPCPQLCSLKGT